LGSGDIGLIMARRLTLEGAKVVGVYEAKPTPSGLTRNIHQCLHDFNIPLYLSKTVTRVIGNDRITAVEVSSVDNNMKPIGGTSEIIECDSLILAVGLIPENEIAEKLSVPIDRKTKGPIVDQTMCTLLDGIYSCGNALHVNDLVDYVSESAEIAGKYASEEVGKRSLVDVNIDENFLYIVPQKLNVNKPCDKTVLFFRSKDNFTKKILTISVDGAIVLQKKYAHLLPPEMERLVVDLSCVKADSKIELTLTD
ncbi:MAG: FAD-dependent oxidoreductase, partial [Clostridia bacterium]